MDNKQLRNYLILMVAAVVGIVFLYGAMSPYQNCMRSNQYSLADCMAMTSW